MSGMRDAVHASIAKAADQAGIYDEPDDRLPVDGVMPDGGDAPGCTHPPGERRRMDDGSQLCGSCWEILPAPEPPRVTTGDPAGGQVTKGDPSGAAVSPPRGVDVSRLAGAADPASGEGWLAFVDPTHYTPEQVEREILYVAGRLNAGARFEAQKLQELADAEREYELAYARALHRSDARAKDQREAAALLACEDEYRALSQAKIVAKTTTNSMHTLRSQLSGLQTVSRSVTASATGR